MSVAKSVEKVQAVAGTAEIGKVTVAQDSNVLKTGTTDVTPKFAVIQAASSGDNTIVSAVTSKKIRVIALNLMSAGTVTVRFESSTAGSFKTGEYPLVANAGIVLPYNPVGWFETNSGELLNMTLNAAVTVGGSLTYIEV
jgi:hypothetical protein